MTEPVTASSFRCGVCGHGRYRPLSSREVVHPLWWKDGYPDRYTLAYVQCPNCGHVTLFPRLSPADYDAIYRFTPGLPRRELSETRKAMLASRRDFIQAQAGAPTPGRLIEVGPAYGDFLALFPEFGQRIGIEPSEHYRHWVSEHRPELDYLPLVLDDALQQRPELRESADLVTACQVLEHAAEPRDFVHRLAELVKPGGRLFIEVPSLEGMAELARPLFQNLYFGHVSQFSKPVILRLGVQAFLEPLAVETVDRFDYPVIQALFRKGDRPERIAACFAAHEQHSLEWARAGAERWQRLAAAHPGPLLVWGIGQDFFDLWDALPAQRQQADRSRLLLVDRNPAKQGHRFFGQTISAPEQVGARPALVLVATRSQLIRDAILRDAGELFRDVAGYSLY